MTRNTNRRQLKVESLQSRNLMAAAILDGNELQIEGSSQNDLIVVSQRYVREYASLCYRGLCTPSTLRIQQFIDVRVENRETGASRMPPASFNASSVDRIMIEAFGGDDTVYNNTSKPSEIFGGSGRDTIWGGYAADQLYGGNQDDDIFGRGGSDTIMGDAGDDTIEGGSGADIIEGGAGADEIRGGSGGDTLYGGNSTGSNSYDLADDIWGDSGDDLLVGHRGNDNLYGGRDDDYLYGNEGSDTLRGDDGEDFLDGGSGADTVRGGRDDDTLTGGNDSYGDVLNDTEGLNTFYYHSGDYLTHGCGSYYGWMMTSTRYVSGGAYAGMALFTETEGVCNGI